MDLPMDNPLKITLVSLVVIIRRIISDDQIGLYMYIPISKSNINFQRAVKRDAILREKFWFWRFYCKKYQGESVYKEEYLELSLREFYLGRDDFLGFKEIALVYLERIEG